MTKLMEKWLKKYNDRKLEELHRYYRLQATINNKSKITREYHNFRYSYYKTEVK